jgi:hypothetical protein
LTVFTLNGTAYLVGGADAQGQFVKNMLRFEMSTLPVSSMST